MNSLLKKHSPVLTTDEYAGLHEEIDQFSDPFLDILPIEEKLPKEEQIGSFIDYEKRVYSVALAYHQTIESWKNLELDSEQEDELREMQRKKRHAIHLLKKSIAFRIFEVSHFNCFLIRPGGKIFAGKDDSQKIYFKNFLDEE